MERLPWKAVLAAVCCNIVFGSAFPMIKLGYEFFGVSDDVSSKILYAGIRFFISGVIVFLIEAAMQKKLPCIRKGNRRNVLLLGLTYTFLQYIFFYVGLSNTTGASGSVVNSSSVFIAILLAHVIYPEDRLTGRKIAGCILGFAGVILACYANADAGKFSWNGEGLIFAAASFFVIGSVFSKKATEADGSVTATAYNLLIGGFLLIVTGILGYNGEITVNISGVLVLLYLIMVSSVGFTLWSSLLRRYPIGKLSVYNFVIPISGTLLSGFFLRENIFRWQYILALALVSIGIYIVNKAAKKA